MKVTNFDLPVLRSWIQENGLRLDTNPYLSGAMEAKALLERLPVEKQPLYTVTKNGAKGIFNGPRFARNYVEDPQYGVPFLGSTDILAADLSTLPFISKKQVEHNPELLIDEKWTLITCSGTIGRTAFSRRDMKGMAGSQHFMRVVPDPDKIPPGYLYAFLSSKFGVPMVIGGTYGAIIQHIEPSHIRDLPVPRLDEELEKKIDDLVNRASTLRTQAAKMIIGVRNNFLWLMDDLSLIKQSPKINIVSATSILPRFDAAYHNPIAEEVVSRIKSRKHSTIGEMCYQVFLPGIFKRIFIENAEHGTPYFTGASLYWLEPIAKSYLSKYTSAFEDVLLSKGTILVQAFGQDGGIVGKPTWVGKHLDNTTTTHMLVRLNTHVPSMAGYLYAFIDSLPGYTLISRLTYGGSIPHLDEAGMASVPVPLLPDDEMQDINKIIISAFDARDEALDCELEARRLVESSIVSGSD